MYVKPYIYKEFFSLYNLVWIYIVEYRRDEVIKVERMQEII